MDRHGVACLIIDPQRDFHGGGSLAVPGADEVRPPYYTTAEPCLLAQALARRTSTVALCANCCILLGQDAQRVRQLLDDHGSEIESITVTMDSHQRMHIAHGLFWTDAAGRHPEPFTTIDRADVETGKWRAVRTDHQSKALAYVQALEKQGKFKLCIWPEHCIIGSEGHNVTAPINEGLSTWAASRHASVEWVHKGQNIFTEMYSALKAEVEVAGDASTGLNKELVERLATHERVLVCGQAKSHCVNCTIRDLVDHWPKSELHRIWLLSDGMSSVPGFEDAGEKFIDDMRAAGLTIVPTAQAFETRLSDPTPLQELTIAQNQTAGSQKQVSAL